MHRRAVIVTGLAFALALNGEALAKGGPNQVTSDGDKPEKKDAKPKQKQKTAQADKNHAKPPPLTDKEKAELKEKAAQHKAALKEKKDQGDKSAPLQHFHTASQPKASHSKASHSKSDSKWLSDGLKDPTSKLSDGGRSPTDKLFN